MHAETQWYAVAMWIRNVLLVALALGSAAAQTRPKLPKSVRLYVLDGGLIHGINPEMFHLKKEDVAQPDMVVAAYLIVHPKGILMWDSGAIPDGAIKGDGTPTKQGLYVASSTMRSQLAAIGYLPSDMTYFGLSHYHGDHTANANDFASATWIVQAPEREAMFGEKTPAAQQANYKALKDSKTKILNGEDFDVFADGTVVVKAAYGHTPGHQVLFVKLKKTGPIVLAGDLFHYQEERGTDKTPTFEFSRDQSLASRQAIEAFCKKTHAQLWIEHDLTNFNKQKKPPDFYE
jgi:N-acyl homoserine lactone hydrolase